MTRRNWFTLLVAPFLARFAPKRHPTIVEVIEGRMAQAQAKMLKILSVEMWSKGRLYTKVGDGPIEEMQNPYWHGQAPVKVFNISGAVTWEKRS